MAYKSPAKEIKPGGVKRGPKLQADIERITKRKKSQEGLRKQLEQEAKKMNLSKAETQSFIKQQMQMAMATPKKTQLTK